MTAARMLLGVPGWVAVSVPGMLSGVRRDRASCVDWAREPASPVAYLCGTLGHMRTTDQAMVALLRAALVAGRRSGKTLHVLADMGVDPDAILGAS